MGICFERRIFEEIEKTPSPDWQIAQDVLEQTEMIFQDVRKNAMQAYIKYKA